MQKGCGIFMCSSSSVLGAELPLAGEIATDHQALAAESVIHPFAVVTNFTLFGS